MAQVDALHQSGTTEEDKIKDAKALYLEKYKKAFLLDHCWLMLKDQPKFVDPSSAKSRSFMPPTLKSISIGEGDCGSGLGTLPMLRDLLVGRPKRPSERTKPPEKM
nr:hypothetical protein CFP56_15414 [Quercus suber]